MTAGEGSKDSALLFFDGVCGLCDRTVTFLFARDRRHRLRFAPLQGETAKTWLTEAQRRELSTVVLAVGEKRYLRSGAALRALALTGGVWAAVAWTLLLVPRPLRDLGYDLVARSRYRLFGKKDACRLPRPEERGYFLA